MGLVSRKSQTFPLSLPLALGSGVGWFLWDVHGFGDSCSNNNVVGPHPPSIVAAALLVFGSGILVAVEATIGTGRTGRAVAGLGLRAAVLTALAIFVATVAFGFSRNCYS